MTKQKKYVLHWRDGKDEIVEGYDIDHAINMAGYGKDDLADFMKILLDYWEEVEEGDNN